MSRSRGVSAAAGSGAVVSRGVRAPSHCAASGPVRLAAAVGLRVSPANEPVTWRFSGFRSSEWCPH